MLTLFALPKVFRGHTGVIQRNAIHSWTLLEPTPRILLLGDDEGTAECAREFGLSHIPGIAANEFGTPLVSDIFGKAQHFARDGVLCYVNADIILMEDFSQAVAQMASLQKRFLLVGRRWTLDIPEQLEFNADWQKRLRTQVERDGALDPPGSTDYFVFPAGFWPPIPPFAIGRFFWDNWLLYQARAQQAFLIDGTPSVMAVHQNHGYNHQAANASGIKSSSASVVNLHNGPEAQRNLELAGGMRHLYTLNFATHTLTSRGLERRRSVRTTIEYWQTRWRHSSRAAYHKLQDLPRRHPLLGPSARALSRLVQFSTPMRRRVGRAITTWRDRK